MSVVFKSGLRRVLKRFHIVFVGSFFVGGCNGDVRCV